MTGEKRDLGAAHNEPCCDRAGRPHFHADDPCVACGNRWPCASYKLGNSRHTSVMRT